MRLYIAVGFVMFSVTAFGSEEVMHNISNPHVADIAGAIEKRQEKEERQSQIDTERAQEASYKEVFDEAYQQGYVAGICTGHLQSFNYALDNGDWNHITKATEFIGEIAEAFNMEGNEYLKQCQKWADAHQEALLSK